MPLIMANSKDGQGHKDKYLDTWKILSQEMLMCNLKALIFNIQKLRPMSIFKTIGHMSRSKGIVLTKRSYHQEYQQGKSFQKAIKLKGQGHKVNNNGIQERELM